MADDENSPPVSGGSDDVDDMPERAEEQQSEREDDASDDYYYDEEYERQLQREEEEEAANAIQSAMQHAAGNQPLYTDVRPSGSKRPKTSVIPKVKTQRIQRSYIVREVHSKYPPEIEGAVRRHGRAPIDKNVAEPIKSFLGILREYMGYDPSTLNFETIEDRMLRSSRANDESDSEHYQRLMSALNILNEIKQSRVISMRTLIELAQKDLNDDRQHKRFVDAIQIKRDKADSEIVKEGTDTRLAEQELLQKQRREDHLGFVLRELEAAEARSKLALLTDFPHRPMSASQVPRRQTTNFDRRLAYVREKLLNR